MENTDAQPQKQGPAGFLKQSRSDAVDQLMKFPAAFMLVTQIARRAMRNTSRFNPYDLQIGQALIGDYESIGATEQNYRTAKHQLAKWGFASFKPTNRGTIATLLDVRIYDINAATQTNDSSNEHFTEGNCDESNEQSNELRNTSTTDGLTTSATTKKKLRHKEFLPLGKGRATQEEIETFCESIRLPKSDGEAMFLHWEEKGWVKNWKLTIRKWKSFGYLPSQKNGSHRGGIHKSPALSFSEREKKRQELTEARNVMWKMKEREGREFTSAEKQRYQELTAKREALTAI